MRHKRDLFARASAAGVILLMCVVPLSSAGCSSIADVIGGSGQEIVSSAAEGMNDAVDFADLEQQVVEEINRVRIDPAGYAASYIEPIRPYYQGDILQYPGEVGLLTNEGVSALDECVQAMKVAEAVGALAWAEGLHLAAVDHVDDQGGTGATGHDGSDGSTFSDRIDRYVEWGVVIGENIYYGPDEQARRIVISLLIDDGVPSRGHRANLLEGAYGLVGVAVGPHPAYGVMCVMDFAGGYR